jgi:hypothetical protein
VFGVVLLGSGFWASVLRSQSTAMRQRPDVDLPFRQYGSIEEVAAWLPGEHLKRTGVALDLRQLCRVIELFVRELDAPCEPASLPPVQNGIKSSDYNDYAKSYAVVASGESRAPVATAGGVTAPGSAPSAAGVIEAGCSYDARQLKRKDGDTFEVACPAGCEKGPAWGTGVYTADSSICRAGIHAGAIPAQGGTVKVRLEPGRPAYRGSLQNGIKSSDYNEYPTSFAVVTP